MKRSVPDYGGLRCTIPFLLRQKGGWCNVGRLASLGGPPMLAEGCIVANPVRDLVGSVGRAELGRGAAARGGGIAKRGRFFLRKTNQDFIFPENFRGVFRVFAKF